MWNVQMINIRPETLTLTQTGNFWNNHVYLSYIIAHQRWNCSPFVFIINRKDVGREHSTSPLHPFVEFKWTNINWQFIVFEDRMYRKLVVNIPSGRHLKIHEHTRIPLWIKWYILWYTPQNMQSSCWKPENYWTEKLV